MNTNYYYVPYGDALGLEVAPALVHLLEPGVQQGSVLLRVEAADQLLARAVQGEVDVPVLLHFRGQVLTHTTTGSVGG